MEVVLIALFLIAAAVLGVYTDRRAKAKKVATVFEGREQLSPEMFHNRYFREMGIPFNVVVGVIEILEEQLDVDMSCLKAEDDFSKNLSFLFDFDSMADVEILYSIEERFKIKIPDNDAENAKSISDIVYLVAKKIKENGQAAWHFQYL